ncbi:hypothetical protein D6C78_08043 [Aureobasidium pullulans]|uniref:Bromo domain-containing protein n=1 Tax=Aureobasidium pullulans TaxID=5580 RepID=A0A4T0BKL4_AURPU|nr:hypothetical protein D6C78_08043 [Aureobasidium pullulans]
MSPHFPRRSRRIKENREQSRVPRVYLTADERSALNYKFCKYVIQTLLDSTDEHVVPFQKPVDAEAENVPDYHSIIKRPMDLSTMLHKLRNDEYPSPQEPGKDFLLIANNCFRYNRPDSDVYQNGVKFQAAYERMWYDGGRWIQEQAARLYSLDNALQVDNMYIGSIGYSSDTSEEEADEDLESPHRSYKEDNHKAQESSDEDDSVTSSSEQPDEEYPADDLDLDNIEHSRSSSHKRTFESITEPQPQALTPTKPDQIPDLDAKPPLKKPRLQVPPATPPLPPYNPSELLQTTLNQIIQTQIKAIITRIDANTSNEFSPHHDFTNLLWADDKGKRFKKIWRQKALEKVSSMEFKDVVVGVEKQVRQAFAETVEEQTKVLLEEIGRSGEAFGRMFGGSGGG